MSEVDRLSNSGLYPALPIADKRSRKDGSNQPPPSEKRPNVAPNAGESQEPQSPRPPKSIIDEYA
ncbi:MAG TPA: hypothetical protein VHY75_09280 [Steroidobacteraceae bacterium]|jgi:hypothetical protein|nr:hypothetical protein [Steroidobacteraceae bacterium]